MSDEAHKLGEVLRAAREAKGVDLTRVERETKIRERYLSALERGEYRELPGSVYTKGFLRNYGTYLGLDPEYLIDLYRLESGTSAVERPRMPAPPRPLATRRSRGFVVTPGAVVAAILTLLVGGFVAWLGYEFVNFARTPELRITEPAGNVSAHTELTITVRGVTAPNARITVDNLPENPTVVADAKGIFELTVGLLPGSNVMKLTATDPVTGRQSEVEERTIMVVTDVAGSPSPGAGHMTLDEPVANGTVVGPVPVSGQSDPRAELQIGATLVTPPVSSFTVTDLANAPVSIQPTPPQSPDPITVTSDDSGRFASELALPPGSWEVVVTVPGIDPVTVPVIVQPVTGLTGALNLSGGDSWLEIDADGTPVAGVSGGIAAEGDTVNLSARTELRIRAGNAGAVRLFINGINIGAMGGNGEVVEWRITRAGE